ncbi:MAG TPA: hypothetical protein DEP05_07585 [Betaproteobacteria bacterium]|nr:hypothetical protein [Betaproteobacteria bacterium]
MGLYRYLRRERIQVVNTHSGIDSWIGAIASKLAGAPLLIRTRHLNLPLRRNRFNFVHFMADRIVTCGESMRRMLISQCGFPPAQLASIPTGVDFSRFRPTKNRSRVRAEIGVGDDDYLILMVGVIRGVKRHAVALEAFRRLAADADMTLALAGDGPMRPDMERLAQSLGIADHVRFLGQREDVPDLITAADLLLLTSRSEGVPQAVTQALGLGTPVVSTDVGGVPELIRHEQTGLLVPAEDPPAVAEGISRPASDPAPGRRLATQGKTHVMAGFSLAAMLDKTERLLHDGLAQKTARR